MGAWGTGAFDNDDAADWVYQLDSDGIDAVDAALGDAFEADDHTQPLDTNAIAAAEVVAAALGRPAADLPESVAILVTGLGSRVTPELIDQARAVTARVLASSEIGELWDESDEGPAWRAAVQDLIRRLDEGR
jgi:hypothetical protein